MDLVQPACCRTRPSKMPRVTFASKDDLHGLYVNPTCEGREGGVRLRDEAEAAAVAVAAGAHTLVLQAALQWGEGHVAGTARVSCTARPSWDVVLHPSPLAGGKTRTANMARARRRV